MAFRNKTFENAISNQKSRRPNTSRIFELAMPKDRASEFTPDRPSVYWLDYIIDETPHLITDSKALMQYYKDCQANLPRLASLAKPKRDYDLLRTWAATQPPMTACGIPLSALNYEPSERIKILAQPKPATLEVLLSGPLPPEKRSASKTRSPGPKPSKPLHYPWNKGRTGSPKVDLGRGDFYNRSRYRMESSSSRASTHIHSIPSSSTANQMHQRPRQIEVRNRVNVPHNMQYAAAAANASRNKPRVQFSEMNIIGKGGFNTPGLLIDRSYAASRTNLRRVETVDNLHNNSNNSNNTPRLTRIKKNPLPFKYAPRHDGCQGQKLEDQNQNNKRNA